MNCKVLSIILMIALCTSAQESYEIKRLNTIDPNESFEDLKQLDPIFEGKKIIGIGESTHGTSEFTTMRHRVFKYLVEEKGYTVFFLEADVSSCRRVNRYIHGNEDDVRDAIREFALWPWLTEEMVEIIEWAKEYNVATMNKIEFVGCDMQFVADDKKELINFFENESLKNSTKEIFKDIDSHVGDKEIDRITFTKWNNFTDSLNKNKHPQINNPEFKLINESLRQFFEFKLNEDLTYNFRDSSMAANMMYYLEFYPEKKAIYFAHNWHVSKYKHVFKSVPSKKSAGRYLSERIGEQYLSLAMITNEGTFNARTYSIKENPNYVFKLKSSDKKSIEYNFAQFDSPLLFYGVKGDEKLDKLKCTQIGAAYGRISLIFKTPRYNQLQNGCYDGFIYIETTTPSKLFPKKVM